MQHTIELDRQTEQQLSLISSDTAQSKDDILVLVIKEFVQQRSLKQHPKSDLKQFLQPYQLNMKGFKFDRELANER